MRIINVVPEMDQLQLGKQGENKSTKFLFDVSDWLEKYPGCTITLVNRRPNENSSYPCVLTTEEDGRRGWVINSADLAIDGKGECELKCTLDDMIEKDKRTWKTKIKKSLSGDGNAPEPWESLMDDIEALVGDAQDAAEDAETAKEAAEEAASIAAHAPIIQDGYWYEWDATTEEYVSTGVKAQGEDGDPGQDATPDLITEDYSDLTFPVAEGKLCYHSGLLYKANQAIATSEEWTAAHWTQTTIEAEQSSLLTAINSKPDTKTSDAQGVDLDVSDENGNVILRLQGGHVKTKEFDSSQVNAAKETTAESDLDIIDEDRNVILRLKNGHIQTKKFDSEENASIIGRNAHITDGVYACCRWHQPNSTSKQFCILIAGDSHTDPTRNKSMIKYLNAVDAFDAGIMLGDMSGNTFADSIEHYTSAIALTQKPFLTVIGNHDVVDAPGESDLFTKYGSCLQYADLSATEFEEGKLYYYKDFVSHKIRIIVLKQYDLTYSGSICFGQEQIDWFIDVLENTPSDYGVIIAEHTNPSRYMTYNMDEKYTSSTWYQSNYAPTAMSGDPVPDIVNAWINGLSISQTYSYNFENPPADLSVSVDFTSRGTGEFISYIGGHWHMDVLGHPTAYSDQNDYHVPAAGFSAATQGDIPRKTGTASEDSFCALSVDRDKKTVKIFHIGAHFTKDAVDRRYFKYSYGT